MCDSVGMTVNPVVFRSTGQWRARVEFPSDRELTGAPFDLLPGVHRHSDTAQHQRGATPHPSPIGAIGVQQLVVVGIGRQGIGGAVNLPEEVALCLPGRVGAHGTTEPSLRPPLNDRVAEHPRTKSGPSVRR